jgi:hypothetical protein
MRARARAHTHTHTHTHTHIYIYLYIVTRRGLYVTYKTDFELDDWIYCTLYIQLWTTGNNNAIVLLHTI